MCISGKFERTRTRSLEREAETPDLLDRDPAAVSLQSHFDSRGGGSIDFCLWSDSAGLAANCAHTNALYRSRSAYVISTADDVAEEPDE